MTPRIDFDDPRSFAFLFFFFALTLGIDSLRIFSSSVSPIRACRFFQECAPRDSALGLPAYSCALSGMYTLLVIGMKPASPLSELVSSGQCRDLLSGKKNRHGRR